MAVHQWTLLGGDAPAVDHTVAFERVALDRTPTGDPGSWVDLGRGWLRGADTLFHELAEHVPWTQGRRWMYDRMVDDPRLSRWYRADARLPHPALATIRDALSARYDVPFGGAGLNYYRDGRDSVAWHRDRELRHLEDTLVAIVTLGGPRPFHVRPRGGGASRDLRPASGDLLVMGGRAQADWEHAVPKISTPIPRISVTFRWARKRV